MQPLHFPTLVSLQTEVNIHREIQNSKVQDEIKEALEQGAW